jgi:hypothetical protein
MPVGLYRTFLSDVAITYYFGHYILFLGITYFFSVITYSIGTLHMYSLIQHDLTWDGGIGHCAKDNTNSIFKNMDIDSEKICMANFLVTTVLLQNIDVATLHMARVPHGPVWPIRTFPGSCCTGTSLFGKANT